jgi:hypothetical protein
MARPCQTFSLSCSGFLLLLLSGFGLCLDEGLRKEDVDLSFLVFTFESQAYQGFSERRKSY